MAATRKGCTARGTASILSPLFGLLHPTLEDGFDFLRTLWCDIQFLEPIVERERAEGVGGEESLALGLLTRLALKRKRNVTKVPGHCQVAYFLLHLLVLFFFFFPFKYEIYCSKLLKLLVGNALANFSLKSVYL